ncbi:hypothetical protein [Nocardia shimofusensis]|uniref:hypothetical protein n=1 Tax=Nocardia shimofusensis TaxID=228596 RepID=UPI00082EFA00|nr:hypothetical protein [Nocardia shimofusensis]
MVTLAASALLLFVTALAAAMVGPGAGPAAAIGEKTLFVAESTAGTVVAVSEDGAVDPLVTGLSSPFDVVVDGDTLYISESGAGRIVTAPTSGGTATPLVIPGLSAPSYIAISGDTLFIVDSGTVYAVPKVGGTPEVLLEDLGNAGGIAVYNGQVYVTINSMTGSVVSVPVTGGTPTTVVSGLTNPLAIAADNGTLYITSSVGPVWSVPVTGGTPTELAELNVGLGIAVDGDTLYLTEDQSGTVYSLPVTGGTLTEIATGLSSPAGIDVGVGGCTGSVCLGGSAF